MATPNPFQRVARLRRAHETRGESEAQGRTPPGQTLTSKFPVLTYGPVQRIDQSDWKLGVSGLIAEPKSWSFEDLLAMPQVDTNLRYPLRHPLEQARHHLDWRAV